MNSNDNYLILNGKKVYLTEEQIKQLGLVEEEKDLFELRGGNALVYITSRYGIMDDFAINMVSTAPHRYPEKYKALVRQIAFDRELHDRLLRYSLNHGGDDIDWSNSNLDKWRIFYNTVDKKFEIYKNTFIITVNSVYFNTEKTAKDAIEEVIKPFIAEHPDYTAYKDGFHL